MTPAATSPSGGAFICRASFEVDRNVVLCATAVRAHLAGSAAYELTNARCQRLTRADRLASLRTGRTAFDSLAHAPQEEQIRVYGDVVLYTTLLTLGGRYGGQAQQGQYRAVVVWVRRDGRWQQVANQMTPVVAR